MKSGKKSVSFQTAAQIFLFVASVTSLMPFLLMANLSTYPTTEIYSRFSFLPGNYTAENLKTVMNGPYLRQYLNSLYIAVINVSLVLTVASACAYGLTKFNTRWGKTLLTFVIATLVLPSQLNIVAFVLEFKNFGLLGTHWPMILPAASPLAVFWLSSYMKDGVPNELLEAARIDGCMETGIFIKVVIPLIRPALGTMALLAFLASWNNFLLPMLTLNKAEMYTLPVAVKNFGNAYLRDIGAQILATCLAVFPIMIVFTFFSKSLIKGLTAGAVKG